MSSSAVPAIVTGAAIIAGVVGILALANRDPAKTVDQEAEELFPRGGAPTARLPRGRRALNYGRAAARCFYRELRQTYSPQDAADIARRALDSQRWHLTEYSHVGKSVRSGCTLLREYHRPRSYRAATARSTR
jgi:hypothetical protein